MQILNIVSLHKMSTKLSENGVPFDDKIVKRRQNRTPLLSEDQLVFTVKLYKAVIREFDDTLYFCLFPASKMILAF